MQEQDKEKLQQFSIIQINENGNKEWQGCLLMVSEIKNWGIQAFCKIPAKGDAYIRLTWEQFEYIGEPIMIPQEN